MNNQKQTQFIAFSNQKGGVGKSALTVLMSSYFHYLKDKISSWSIATTRNTVFTACGNVTRVLWIRMILINGS